MQFKLQLVAQAGNGQADDVIDIAVFDKACEQVEQLGLTLAEAKALLQATQQALLEQQATTFLRAHAACPCCSKQLGRKGQHSITYRTLFGNAKLVSPRLRACRCQPHTQASFSPLTTLFTERTAPELQFMETKWAALVSYGLTVKALQDFLPVDAKLNATTVRNHTLQVAQRCEAALGEECVGLSDDAPEASELLPPSQEPITVGIDGGHLRHWDTKQQRFEVIVGKAVPPDQAAKCFGLVQTYDTKPKRRLFDVLTSQGLQPQQKLCFMSDGEASVRQLQVHLHPRSDHLLDWFHLTMRITVLGQFVKGLLKLDPDRGSVLAHQVERLKWKLWHGKATEACEALADIEMRVGAFAETYPKFTALTKHVHEFQRYLERNGHLLVNYGARWQAGQVISTAFVESLVNSLLDKRFDKKQQMQWTPHGAHLLLQMRTKVLNAELGASFKAWYPDFELQERDPAV
jgi:hypothetical protein